MTAKSLMRCALPVGLYRGTWSGFTVVVSKEPKAIIFEVNKHSSATVSCWVTVKTNNVAYIKERENE